MAIFTLAQARYFFQVAARMLVFIEPDRAKQAARDAMADATRALMDATDHARAAGR
jgi:hypothetical protein